MQPRGTQSQKLHEQLSNRWSEHHAPPQYDETVQSDPTRVDAVPNVALRRGREQTLTKQRSARPLSTLGRRTNNHD